MPKTYGEYFPLNNSADGAFKVDIKIKVSNVGDVAKHFLKRKKEGSEPRQLTVDVY